MVTQTKVDALFDAADYGRAFFIYSNELAPIGDKYAQYMVGYMYLTGKGVEQDSTAASAWYRLAAERGTREFVAVRDQLARELTAEQIYAADRMHKQLRLRYSDLSVLLSSIKRDFDELKERTGSRLSSGSSPVTVLETRFGRSRSGAEYYGDIRERLEERLLLLEEVGDFQDFETEPDKVNVHELERRILERLRFSE